MGKARMGTVDTVRYRPSPMTWIRELHREEVLVQFEVLIYH